MSIKKGVKVIATRGAVGFRVDATDKMSYNHSSSMFDWTGKRVLKELRELLTEYPSLAEFKQKVRSIKFVEPGKNIPKKRWEALGVFSYQKYKNWQNTIPEGCPAFFVKHQVMIEHKGYLQFGYDCQYGYIINLDKKVLEIYVANYKRGRGRYAKTKNPPAHIGGSGYYGCSLLVNIPFEVVLREDHRRIINRLEYLKGVLENGRTL